MEKSGSFFGWQLVGIVVIIAWTAVMSGLFFYVLRFFGKLRVPLMDEIIGLDITEMGAGHPEVLNMVSKSATFYKQMQIRRELNYS